MQASASAHLASDRLARFLAACGLVAPFIFIAFVFAATQVTPGYSQLKESVSQLGGQGRPHAQVMNTGFFFYSLLILAFACGLRRQLPRRGAEQAVWRSLVLYALAVALCGVFQAGSRAGGTHGNVEDRAHVYLAIVAFMAFTASMLALAWSARRDPSWRHLSLLSLIIAVVNVPLAVAFQYEWTPSFEGLVQRSFFTTSLVWVQAVAVTSMRLARRSAQAATLRAID